MTVFEYSTDIFTSSPSVVRGDRKKHKSCWSNLSSDGIVANDIVIIKSVAIDPVCQISTLLWFLPSETRHRGIPHAKQDRLLYKTSRALQMACGSSSSTVHAL